MFFVLFLSALLSLLSFIMFFKAAIWTLIADSVGMFVVVRPVLLHTPAIPHVSVGEAVRHRFFVSQCVLLKDQVLSFPGQRA